MKDQVETVIVGGGQAGLAMSYYLRQLGHEHVILVLLTDIYAPPLRARRGATNRSGY